MKGGGFNGLNWNHLGPAGYGGKNTNQLVMGLVIKQGIAMTDNSSVVSIFKEMHLIP